MKNIIQSQKNILELLITQTLDIEDKDLVDFFQEKISGVSLHKTVILNKLKAIEEENIIIEGIINPKKHSKKEIFQYFNNFKNKKNLALLLAYLLSIKDYNNLSILLEKVKDNDSYDILFYVYDKIK